MKVVICSTLYKMLSGNTEKRKMVGGKESSSIDFFAQKETFSFLLGVQSYIVEERQKS